MRAALFDDLNAPEAMGALFTFVTSGERRARPSRYATKTAIERARKAFAVIDGVLDVRPHVARLTLQGDTAAWTSVLGRVARPQLDLGVAAG